MAVRPHFPNTGVRASTHARIAGALALVMAASAFTAQGAAADDQPTHYAGWSMDDAEGRVAHAVDGAGAANPAADLRFTPGVEFGQPGNLPWDGDRSVRLDGRREFGRVRPIVDTTERFMFSVWVKLAALEGDQVAISQGAADGSVFELGWIGGRWAFRHRTVHGDVVTSVTRDMPQAADGTPWTEHWVSLMGGYDPATGDIWLRSQAEGHFDICAPDEPWNCETRPLMPPETKVAPIGWTASPAAGPLLFGATSRDGRRRSFWNGWLDDSLLRPLTHTDEPQLRVIYGETVPTPPTDRT